ncbi:hypothetical protein PYW08_006507 [Mythimna loreyi]|uniref:Uncharacterized protein n=1 Tax=Mythimna loreyi TaxID=667449 RepID=A0ACC2QQC3_9NEOP|nr:hypothetical protein PYW08_006507 [Mythimna loreyi]
MIATQLTLFSLIVYSTNALSIGTVSVQNVTKREANLGDLFPDWVPFKNKHGEELGEFVQVKNKPKKRLAPPMNFILRAVAEPEGEDYYEKEGGGGSDSEDYYEKKDWSDTNRPVIKAKEAKPVNHTEISEIDGVVNIITKPPENPVVEALKRAKEKAEKSSQEAEESEEGNDSEKKTVTENKEVVPEVTKPVEVPASRKKARKYEEEADYEDDSAPQEKRTPDPLNEADVEKLESEAKKVRILNTVDELKQRHAKEQVAISEKAKEEEMYQEEREREKIQAQLSVDSDHDKYDDKPRNGKKKFNNNEYDEYEDDEKYKPKTHTETTKPPTTTKVPKRTTPAKKKEIKEKKIETGKLSVFKNPQLYMVYDYDTDESSTTSTTTTTTTAKPAQANAVEPSSKFSAKYSLMNGDNPDRISLVPEDEGKEGEPALFFPKKRRNKKNKAKPFGTYESKKANVSEATTAADIASTDATGSDSIKVDTTIETGPSASDLVPTHTEPVTDAIPSSTQHHKEPEKAENYHREKGGGREHHSEHDEEHSEEGKKAYEGKSRWGAKNTYNPNKKLIKAKPWYYLYVDGVHEETKSAKGYHDKENHLGKYDDHGDLDEHHERESGHYGDHHHEEHGKKHAKYEESGKHSKGHSTKGSHDIHKKEEFEKKVEFFEEEGDSGEEEKHGGFNEEHGHSKGGHFKNGNLQAGHEQHAKGESGHFAKGGHLHMHKGHKAALGHDGHSQHGNDHHQKAGKDGGKKWIYHHGVPAKTTNLVLIDRRAEQLFHGPQYFG